MNLKNWSLAGMSLLLGLSFLAKAEETETAPSEISEEFRQLGIAFSSADGSISVEQNILGAWSCEIMPKEAKPETEKFSLSLSKEVEPNDPSTKSSGMLYLESDLRHDYGMFRSTRFKKWIKTKDIEKTYEKYIELYLNNRKTSSGTAHTPALKLLERKFKTAMHKVRYDRKSDQLLIESSFERLFFFHKHMKDDFEEFTAIDKDIDSSVIAYTQCSRLVN